jgi:Zn-dependent protease
MAAPGDSHLPETVAAASPLARPRTPPPFGGSLRLGAYAGIGVFVHWTFGLLIAWIVLVHVNAGLPWQETAAGVGFVLSLFFCVLLHEFGHALAARRYGIETRDITLLPIGGLARLERIPEKPAQELVVALAGPAVNVVIAGSLLLILGFLGRLEGLSLVDLLTGSFWERLMMVNVTLVVFNLLPAFPMDGGRVLRAVLASRLGRRRATRIAAGVGQLLAVGLGLLGLLGATTNPFLVVLALFVFFGARTEARTVEAETAFEGFTVRSAMMTRFRTLDAQDSLHTAVAALLAGSQQDFPIVDAGRLVGLLRRNDLVEALTRGDATRPLAGLMIRAVPAADVDEPLREVVTRMHAGGHATLPVLEAGHLAGLLTYENISEFVVIRNALGKGR